MSKGRQRKKLKSLGTIVGTIDLATLMEFELKTPGTRVCTCMDFELEREHGTTWAGGEHLVSTIPGTQGEGKEVRTHYYPDTRHRVLLILKIETVHTGE